MRQIGTQSAKYFRRFVTAMLVVAMVITSLTVSSVDSQAAKKVKKVTIGVKVGGSGILVLKKGQSKKLKVSVTPKKASKKVTYKSSKASVVSVSSKGVVKARKSKGSAKITVTSKQNPKKKATIKVKIGTPVKKVAISKNATSTWQSANYTIVEKNGQKTKVYPKYTDKLKATKNTFTLMNGRNMVVKASVSPKKATRKSLKWSTNKGSILKVIGNGTKATVIARKVGKANVIAQATDGSGKKAVVKVNVVKFKSDKTPAPTATPDTRKRTVVEDFESYEVGTTWTRFTAGGYANSGTMTVVQDPEDATNKCLKVTYDGADQSFDYAPVFQADLTKLKDSEGNSTASKKLGSYTGIGFDARVISNDPSSVQYKKAYCYFDQADAIKASDYFAANANKSASAHVDKDGNPVPAGDANEYKPLRFGVEISMAEGSDKETGITLWNGNSSKESNKYFPFAYSTWIQSNTTTHFAANSCTAGYKVTDGSEPKVGFASRSLTFDTARIKEADSTLLDQNKFDFVLGSTYEGGSKYKLNNISVTLYYDNISLIEEEVPITDFAISAGDNPRVAPGGKLSLAVTYTPAETTQKELTWTTSDAKVSVDGNNNVIVADDFDFGTDTEKTVTITATSKFNPSLTKSVNVTVYQPAKATEDYVLDFETMYDKELSGDLTIEKTKDADGVDCYKFNFTDKNQRIYFKLPENIDLASYQKYEIVGFVPEQLSLDFFDETLPTAQKDTVKTNWWKSAPAGTYPFYKGSCANRMSDGTFVAPNAKETESVFLTKIKNAAGTEAEDPALGNYGAIRYIAIGNATGSDFVPGTYYIYSFKLKVADQNAEVKELPYATLPFADSFETESPSVECVSNSKIVAGTTDIPAADGNNYLSVGEKDRPSILLDNREGTKDKKFTVSAYVRTKDGKDYNVSILSEGTYKDKKYESYVDAEKVSDPTIKSTTKALSEDWQKITATVTVKAGTSAEVNVAIADGIKTADGEFLLDNVTVTAK